MVPGRTAGGEMHVLYARGDPPATFEKRAGGFPLAALGKVTAHLSTEASPQPSAELVPIIVSHYRVDVTRWIKGCGPSSIKVRVRGGQVGNAAMKGDVELKVGEEVLLLLAWPGAFSSGFWGTAPEDIYPLTPFRKYSVSSGLAIGEFTMPLSEAMARIKVAPTLTPGLPPGLVRVPPTLRPAATPTPGPAPSPGFCPEAAPASTPTPPAAAATPSPGLGVATPVP